MRCPECNGDRVIVTFTNAWGMDDTRDCPECDGTGEVDLPPDPFDLDLRELT